MKDMIKDSLTIGVLKTDLEKRNNNDTGPPSAIKVR